MIVKQQFIDKELELLAKSYIREYKSQIKKCVLTCYNCFALMKFLEIEKMADDKLVITYECQNNQCKKPNKKKVLIKNN